MLVSLATIDFGQCEMLERADAERHCEHRTLHGQLSEADEYLQVDITCGRENALVSISEPEKCEYFFKVTSPALCWPLEEGASQESMGLKAEL